MTTAVFDTLKASDTLKAADEDGYCRVEGRYQAAEVDDRSCPGLRRLSHSQILPALAVESNTTSLRNGHGIEPEAFSVEKS